MDRTTFGKAKAIVQAMDKHEETIRKAKLCIEHVQKGGSIHSRMLDFSFRKHSAEGNSWIQLEIHTNKRQQLMLLHELVRDTEEKLRNLKIEFKCL